MLGVNSKQTVRGVGVGVARRPDVQAILVSGPPAGVERTTEHLLGTALAVGAWRRRDAVWWGRPSTDRLLVAGSATSLAWAIDLLRTVRQCLPGIALTLEEDGLVAIGVVGPSTRALLAALDGGPVFWLPESDASAIGFVAPDLLADVEDRISEAERACA